MVAIALVLLAGSGSAGADGPAATLSAKGWWWEAQQLPTTIPPPPNVKAGQLNVQGDPSGKAAYSAVRYAIDASHTVSSLTLKVGDNGDQGGDSAVLLACRTGSAWTPAEAGAWKSAPQVTTACINGQKAADGKSWTFAVGALQTGTVLDIAIVPGVDPSTKQSSTFSLTFDAPSNDALVTSAGTPPTISTGPSTFGATGEATAGSSATASGGSGSTFHPPAVSPVATGLPSDKVGETATAPAKQAATQPGLNTALATATPKDRNKTPGFIVLGLAALVGLYAFRQDSLMAANGGSLPGAPAEVAGLGRFAQPRNGQPPALT
jgi:hypothetical protein